MPIPGDNPIRDANADVLGRTATAKSFAGHILELDASEGAAVGVFGPWGSGKTSFINLARTEFEQAEIPVLDFNPWMFSGAEQLVGRFFDELSAELRLRNFDKVGEALKEYGDALTAPLSLLGVPLVKEFATAALKTAGSVVGRPTSVNQYRKDVEDALRERERPIIVVLDDVDRLSVSEIRDVFKLARLTAGFPNLIYIVLCDRLRVEQALGEDGLSGRDYLEKIIQYPFDLPEAPEHILGQRLLEEIENACEGIKNHGLFDKQVWHDVSREIVRPLIRNMRDVRRYAAAIRGTVAGLEGKVALADVLGLEAIRIFMPDVFKRLPDLMDILTARSQLSSADSGSMSHEAALLKYSGEPENMKIDVRRIGKLIKAGKTPGVVQAMIRILFPACGKKIFGGSIHRKFSDKDDQYVEKIRKDLSLSTDRSSPEKFLVDYRVANEAIFRLYLEHTATEDVSVAEDTRQAFDRMADRGDLHEFMRSLTQRRRSQVIRHLEGFKDRFREEHVVPGSIVLLNLLPDMLENPVPTYDRQVIVQRIIAQLFQALNNTAAAEAAVRRILPEVAMLFPKVLFVFEIGYRGEFGQNLVSKTAASKFENELLNLITGTSIDDLTKESDLDLVFRFANTVVGSSKDPFDSKKSVQLTFVILRSVLKKLLGADSIGPVQDSNRASLRASLVDLYGGEDAVRARIENLRAQFETLKPWIEETQNISLEDAAKLPDRADNFLSGSQLD